MKGLFNQAVELKSMVETMRSNLAADVKAGYGMSAVVRQLVAIEDKEKELRDIYNTMDSYKNSTARLSLDEATELLRQLTGLSYQIREIYIDYGTRWKARNAIRYGLPAGDSYQVFHPCDVDEFTRGGVFTQTVYKIAYKEWQNEEERIDTMFKRLGIR